MLAQCFKLCLAECLQAVPVLCCVGQKEVRAVLRALIDLGRDDVCKPTGRLQRLSEKLLDGRSGTHRTIESLLPSRSAQDRIKRRDDLLVRMLHKPAYMAVHEVDEDLAP